MTWQERVQRELAERQRKSVRKRYVNLEKLERRKDNFGRWLRNGRRVDPDGRDIVRVSIPGELANRILAESQDANYPYSKLIVVLATLGLPVYQDYLMQILEGKREKFVPKIVEEVVSRAFKKTRPAPQGWRGDIEKQLQAASLNAKHKREKGDPTEIALRQFRGN